MRGFPVLFFLYATTAMAQFSDPPFSNLATTHDGNQVFFVTPLRERGTDQVTHAKLFAWSESGLRLLFQRSLEFDRSSSIYFTFPQGVSASSDGSLVAYSAGSMCFGGSSCLTRELSVGFVSDRLTGAEISPGPHVRVSRNGRYVLWWVSSGATLSFPKFGILDRVTGRTETGNTALECGDVASNGMAVVAEVQGLTAISPDGARKTLSPGIPGCPRIDDAGAVAVFTDSRKRLMSVRIASGALTPLTQESVEAAGASISADGLSVLYIGANQLFSVAIDGSSRKQLTNLPEGVAEAIISGDGRVGWIATVDGRLLKFDLATGGMREVLAPPLLQLADQFLMPGSLTRYGGRRLTRVRFDGRAGATVSARPDEILVQVPWDLLAPTGCCGTVMVSADRDDSPLEAVTRSPYATFRPTAFLSAIHEDWSGLVTQQSPARPGELLHIYATGMGPVECPVQTGEAAPLDRLCRTTQPMQWDYWWTHTDSMPAEVLFTGLAPGTVGLYQIEARVPANPPATRLKLIADRFGYYVAADFFVSAATRQQ